MLSSFWTAGCAIVAGAAVIYKREVRPPRFVYSNRHIIHYWLLPRTCSRY